MSVKKGSLTQFEKFAIIGMFYEGVDPEEMKVLLNRAESSQVIEKYLVTYKEKIEKQAAEKATSDRRNKVDKAAKTKKEPLDQDYNVSYDHQAVLRKMSMAGIHGEDALRLIQKALPKFENRKAEVNEIYNEAMSKVGARELMIRDSNTGSRGVAVMTEAASGKGEHIRNKVRNHTPDYVFSPNAKTNRQK